MMEWWASKEIPAGCADALCSRLQEAFPATGGYTWEHSKGQTRIRAVRPVKTTPAEDRLLTNLFQLMVEYLT